MIRYFSLGLKSTSRTYKAAQSFSETAACPDATDVPDDSDLVPRVAEVLTAVGEVLLLPRWSANRTCIS